MDFQECDPTVRAYYHIHIYIFRYDAVLGGEWSGTLLEYKPKTFLHGHIRTKGSENNI